MTLHFRYKIAALYFLCILALQSIHAQCGDYSQVLNSSLNQVRFWDEQHGFVAGPETLLTTSDGGITWNRVELMKRSDTNSPILDVALVDESKAFVVGLNNTVFSTSDKGQTWQARVINPERVEQYYHIHFPTDQVGYLAGNYEAYGPNDIVLYKTTDGGESWTELNLDLVIVSSGTEQVLDLQFVDELTGFISLDISPGAYKTTDGGQTWLPAEDIGAFRNMQFTNATTGYFTKRNGSDVDIYKTTDAGESWNITSLFDPLYVSYFSDVFVTNQKVYVSGSTFEGIRSVDLITGEESFGFIGVRGYHTSTYFINDMIGFVVGRKENSLGGLGRFTAKTTNGGQTWELLDDSTGIDGTYNSVATYFKKIDENTFYYSYAAYQNNPGSYIYKSFDKGVSWELLKSYENEPGRLLFASDTYISHLRHSTDNVTNPVVYSESFDGGINWSDLDPVDQEFYHDWKQISETELFGTISDPDNPGFNSFGYSNTKGQTWQVVPIPDNTDLAQFNFADADNGIIGVYNYAGDVFSIYRTHDRGSSWQEIITFEGSEANPDYNFDVTESTLVIYPSSSSGNLYIYDLDSELLEQQDIDYNSTRFKILDDTSFLRMDNSWDIYISQDAGVTWQNREYNKFDGDNSNIYVDSPSSIYLWKHNFMEHLTDYIPEAPDLIEGAVQADVNTLQIYGVANNEFAAVQWEVVSGGTYNFQSGMSGNSIRVTWLEPGTHSIRARYFNECGASEDRVLTVDVEGFNFPNDNFQVRTEGESCLGANNGSIEISTLEYNSYTATIDGMVFNFNQTVTIEDLAPGDYLLCISIGNTYFEQCYNLTIEGAQSLTGSTSLSENSLIVTIETGSPPYTVYQNSTPILQTNATSFQLVDYDYSDIVVKSSKDCEGELQVSFDVEQLMNLSPNPSNGVFQLEIGVHSETSRMRIFNSLGQELTSNRITRQVSDRAYEIDMRNHADGLYVLQLHLGTKVYNLKLIKN